jgi:hypothetical protein
VTACYEEIVLVIAEAWGGLKVYSERAGARYGLAEKRGIIGLDLGAGLRGRAG